MEAEIMNKVYIEKTNSIATLDIDKYKSSVCTIYNDKIFFWSTYDKRLCSVDVNDYKISIESACAEILNGSGEPARWMVTYEEFILTITGDCRQLIKYNPKNREFEIIKISDEFIWWGHYIFATIWNECIFLFTKNPLQLKKINLITKDIVGVDLSVLASKNLEFVCGVRMKNEIFLFQRIGNQVLNYNLETGQIVLNPIDISEIENAYVDQDDIYIIQGDGTLYRYCACCNQLQKIINRTKGKKYGMAILGKKKIVELPSASEDILIIDKKTEEVEVYEEYPKDFKYTNTSGRAKYYGYVEYKGTLIFPMRFSNYILMVDKQNSKLSWLIPQIPSKYEEGKFYVEVEKKTATCSVVNSLDSFLKMILMR